MVAIVANPFLLLIKKHSRKTQWIRPGTGERLYAYRVIYELLSF